MPRRIDHPFFCTKKRCRKTAEGTPEYLSEADWALLQALTDAMKAGDRAAFDALLDSRDRDCANRYAFFYRIAGWPEGLRYYMEGSSLVRERWFQNFIVRDLAHWIEAVHANAKISALVA